MSGERFTLVITATRSTQTATQRLKHLLKVLHRGYGFRCDELWPALHDETEASPEAIGQRENASRTRDGPTG